MPADRESEGGFGVLLERVECYWPDLLRQGSMVRKFADRPDGPFVLQFRQRRTGTRDGRQKRLYVGSKALAERLMAQIWRRREEYGVRYRPGREPDREERPGPRFSLGELIVRLMETNRPGRAEKTAGGWGTRASSSP